MHNRKALSLLVFFLICTSVIFSCNTNKNATESSTIEKNRLQLQLKDSYSSNYISETYNEFHPTDMSRSNRTLNQYVVNFNCTDGDFSKLKNLLEADVNIEILKSVNQAEIQSSKSVKSAKTKSIRNNN